MFYKKKYQIERANNAMRMQELGQLSREKAELRSELDDAQKKLTDMALARNTLLDENERLIRENGAIKRDLAAEIRQKQELSDLLDAERKAHPVCLSDCATRSNKGPGGSRCRGCIRNPFAKDKYQKEETA